LINNPTSIQTVRTMLSVCTAGIIRCIATIVGLSGTIDRLATFEIARMILVFGADGRGESWKDHGRRHKERGGEDRGNLH
jgi:hypothetical protein